MSFLICSSHSRETWCSYVIINDLLTMHSEFQLCTCFCLQDIELPQLHLVGQVWGYSELGYPDHRSSTTPREMQIQQCRWWHRVIGLARIVLPPSRAGYLYSKAKIHIVTFKCVRHHRRSRPGNTPILISMGTKTGLFT